MLLAHLTCLAALCVALAAGVSARADDSAPPGSAIARPVLPGIGGQDPRRRVDPNAAPWRAVGKLQAAPGTLHLACTGALVGRELVLTAAHCLLNPRTQRFLPAGLFHFLTGYSAERMAGHARGVSYVIGAGYDPRDPATRGADWALLTIDEALGAGGRVLPLAASAPAPGAKVMLGGYSGDHRYLLTADADCRILGIAADPGGRLLLHHDCTATHGASGAPLLLQQDGEWRVAGIAVESLIGKADGYAVSAEAVRAGARL